MNTKSSRARKSTMVDLAPLSLDDVDGHRWAVVYGHSPVNARTEARWWRERAERVTVELSVVGG